MLSRRLLIGAATALISNQALGQAVSGVTATRELGNRPTFGALRWDAWYSMTQFNPLSQVTPNYELAVSPGTMAPNTWHFRCPVHSIVGSNTISWAGATQATFDAEIQAALSFGLDYWVFDHYDPAIQPTLNVALGFYVSSTQSPKPRFCLMEGTSGLGSTGNFTTQINTTLSFIQNPNYFFVKGNRPLVYLFYTTANLASNWGNSNANLKACLDALRSLVQGAGFGNPYIVVMPGGTSSNLGTVATALAADSVSRYVGPIPAAVGSPYTVMASTAQGFWPTDAAAFAHSIPTCTIGYDPTPLNQIPPSFWTTNTNTVVEPTQAELIAHLQNGANFARSTDVRTVLIYSWSECAEGGVAMMPTLGNPTGSKGLALRSVT